MPRSVVYSNVQSTIINKKKYTGNNLRKSGTGFWANTDKLIKKMDSWIKSLAENFIFPNIGKVPVHKKTSRRRSYLVKLDLNYFHPS